MIYIKKCVHGNNSITELFISKTISITISITPQSLRTRILFLSNSQHMKANYELSKN